MGNSVIEINSKNGSYPVIIGDGLINRVDTFIPEKYKSGKMLVVTDVNVNRLYSKKLSLSGEVYFYVVKAGEKSKNLKTVEKITEFMLDKNFSRTDLIVALGGGVVGDIAGFTAAIYERGIDFVQIPTTLLAGTDSSVGGKTAVNLNKGKNIIGAFKAPILVVFDTETLYTLPEEEIKSGLGEVIKYALIDGKIFDAIDKEEMDLKEVITLCVECKKRYVEEDETDLSIRAVLNLGHTFGHAIERKYGLKHGVAVGEGLRIIVKACYDKGVLPKDEYEKIVALFDRYGVEKFDKPVADLFPAIKFDKKIRNGKLNVVLIKGVGKCEIRKFDVEKFGAFFI